MRTVQYLILYVQDLDASIRFYRDIVGIPFKFSEHGYAEFDAGGVKLGLYDRARLPDLIGPEAAERPLPSEILVPVEDADAEADRSRATGAKVLWGPVDRPWGHRTVHVLDPDGNVVELAQAIPRERPRE